MNQTTFQCVKKETLSPRGKKISDKFKPKTTREILAELGIKSL